MARGALSSTFLIVFVVSLFNDPKKTAGIGIGLSVYAICVEYIIVGFIVPCETLTGNAFGQHDLRVCGVYYNRGLLIIMTVLVISLSAIMVF